MLTIEDKDNMTPELYSAVQEMEKLVGKNNPQLLALLALYTQKDKIIADLRTELLDLNAKYEALEYHYEVDCNECNCDCHDD